MEQWLKTDIPLTILQYSITPLFHGRMTKDNRQPLISLSQVIFPIDKNNHGLSIL